MTQRPADRIAGLERSEIRQIFESAAADCINLGLGQPDLGAPDVLRQALAEQALHGPSGYGPTAGDPELRALIASTYPTLASDASSVVVTTGCQQAMFVSLGCLVDAGHEILVPDPGFPGSRQAAAVWGAEAASYPLRPENGFHIDVDDIRAAIGPRTRAVVVITPSNPTGTAESQQTIDALTDLTEERGLALIVDDTYRYLAWNEQRHAPCAPSRTAPHVVVCGGLSKSLCLTGWRVGWAVCADAAWMNKVSAMQQTVTTCAPTPVQAAARVAFSEQGIAARSHVHDRFRARRDAVHALLSGSGLEFAPLEGAFFAWVRVPGPWREAGEARAACRRLMEDKIVLIPGTAFGSTSDWLRISYALPRARLEPAVERIVAVLREGPR